MKVSTSKLKTLKDIDILVKMADFLVDYIRARDIRTVAKEWITWWKYCIDTVGFNEEIVACYESQIRAFRHFFNLKE